MEYNWDTNDDIKIHSNIFIRHTITEDDPDIDCVCYYLSDPYE